MTIFFSYFSDFWTEYQVPVIECIHVHDVLVIVQILKNMEFISSELTALSHFPGISHVRSVGTSFDAVISPAYIID